MVLYPSKYKPNEKIVSAVSTSVLNGESYANLYPNEVERFNEMYERSYLYSKSELKSYLPLNDPLLTTEGKKQAQTLQKIFTRFENCQIYVSPLLRTLQTVESGAPKIYKNKIFVYKNLR